VLNRSLKIASSKNGLRPRLVDCQFLDRIDVRHHTPIEDRLPIFAGNRKRHPGLRSCLATQRMWSHSHLMLVPDARIFSANLAPEIRCNRFLEIGEKNKKRGRRSVGSPPASRMANAIHGTPDREASCLVPAAVSGPRPDAARASAPSIVRTGNTDIDAVGAAPYKYQTGSAHSAH
jgi:hypothetical protein